MQHASISLIISGVILGAIQGFDALMPDREPGPDYGLVSLPEIIVGAPLGACLGGLLGWVVVRVARLGASDPRFSGKEFQEDDPDDEHSM